MGRHGSAEDGPPQEPHRPRAVRDARRDDDRLRALGPVTDPLLLDAVQQELRRTRRPSEPATPPAPQPRVVARSAPAVAVAAQPVPTRAPASDAPPERPATGPVAAAGAPPAADARLAPAPPVSARRRDDPATDSLPVLPAALHRGRTGAEPRRAASGPHAASAAPTGAPALDLGRDGGPTRSAIRPSGRAIAVGLLVGVAVVALLSVLAVVR